MKIKKVEIQAFRAYMHVDDGTFDFKVGTDSWANFVSIYAPNGFGKTSFYDAVEWGYTKNIHRFLRKHKFNQEVAKSEKNLNALEQQYILKNRHASHLDGYVKLHTTNSVKPIESKIPKPRKGGVDYKFNEKETVRRYFQEVILSQEWIDAFLKEDNASDRYRTFMDYFGDKDLDQYYRCLISLLRANEANIASLQQQLDSIQLELTFSGDTEVLTKINEQVTAANSLGAELKSIDAGVTEKDLHHYAALLLEKLHACSFSLLREESIIAYIETAFTGDEHFKGIDKYFESLQRLQKSSATESMLTALLDAFTRKEAILQAIKAVEMHITSVVKEKNDLQKIIDLLSVFSEVVRQIEESEKEKKVLAQSLLREEKTLADLKRSQIAATLRVETSGKKVQELSEKIKALPARKQALQDLLGQKAQLEEAKKWLTGQLQAQEEFVKRWVTEKNTLDKILTRVRKGDLTALPSSISTFYAERINTYQKFEVAAREAEQRIKTLEAQVQQQNNFISELEQFVAKGVQIVNNTQASSCPLCTHDYGSFAALASSLSGNKMLSKQLQQLINSKAEEEILLSSWKKECQLILTELSNILEEEVARVTEQLQEARKSMEFVQVQSNSNKEALEKWEASHLQLFSFFGSKDPETFEKDIQLELKGTEAERVILFAQQAESVASCEAKAQEIELMKASIKAIEVTLAKLASGSYYREVQSFHQIHFAAEPFARQLYEERMANIESRIGAFQAELKDLQAHLAECHASLGNHNLEATTKHLELFQQTKSLLQSTVATFEQFVHTKLDLTVAGLDQSTLEARLNDQRDRAKARIEKNERLQQHYALLQQLIQNVQPFLKFEKAKKTDEEVRNRLSLLRGKVKEELEAERRRVADYINEQINSFFYEDLINSIYRKIDPHPEYTHIKFQCDFTEEKPQLNVSVTNQNQDHYLIPNLYFSTAQLNILSLSIFLAKALNVCDESGNPVDCIFIDDPIQSMDSINILSTIDLLRSIVVNQKKQIILSTHDENFHELLQKKLPTDLFKSKFIELETFGKVKKERAIIN